MLLILLASSFRWNIWEGEAPAEPLGELYGPMAQRELRPPKYAQTEFANSICYWTKLTLLEGE